MDIRKESMVEYIENIYALGSNYLKNHNDNELAMLLRELEVLEDNIMECNDIDIFSGYETLLNDLIDKVEGIINE